MHEKKILDNLESKKIKIDSSFENAYAALKYYKPNLSFIRLAYRKVSFGLLTNVTKYVWMSCPKQTIKSKEN